MKLNKSDTSLKFAWFLWGLGVALFILLFVVASQVPAYPKVIPGPPVVAPNPPTSTITGSLQTATGGTVTNGTLTFSLSQPAVVSGTSSVSANTVSCYTSTAGNVVGVPDPLATPVLSTNTIRRHSAGWDLLRQVCVRWARGNGLSPIA